MTLLPDTAAVALIECMATRLYPAAGELTQNVITSLLRACSDELKLDISRRLAGRPCVMSPPSDPAFWAVTVIDGIAHAHGVTGCAEPDLTVLLNATATHMQQAMQQWLADAIPS